MNIKTMLITALATLHAESLLTEPQTDHEVIRKVLAESRLPDYVDEDDERLALTEIKAIIEPIIDGQVTYDHDAVMRQLKLATTQNRPLYDTVVEFIAGDDIPDDTKPEERVAYLNKMVSRHYFQLRQSLNAITLRKTLGQAFGALNGTETRIDLSTALGNLRDSISTFTERSHNKIPSLVNTLNTANAAPFAKVFSSIKDKAAGHGLRTGWQSMNRMMGCNGGITEEMWLMPALPFNCKSLFSLCMAISVPVFNTPEYVMKDVKGDLQPMILDLSLENELDINIATAYQMLYGHFEGVKADMVNQDVTAMADYVCSKLNRNGWNYEFQKHTNSDFKVHYLNDLISDAKRRGYHVVGIRADYFGTINKAGHGNGIAGSDIKEIYRIARNIQVVRNRGFILGPHQISPEGKRLKAIDESAFVKSLPGRGLYDTCSSLDNEADGEMFFNKRVIEGRSYLEVQRGKHRTIIDTPEKHHYTVIPFEDHCILPWDVDKEVEVTANSINKFTGGMSGDLF
ncbi:hypothetical protein F0D22_14715 [Salmonella enterica subsp. enterica]|nr:hypothetical protein [Salmonella enterica subsp. enterica serovar Enteritidis]ECQ9027278.1 hypothetical protein [Salmonella enterica subsp. enterica serovar Enteritidis]